MDRIFDAVIIGAGPAGISAAIYLKRSNIKFALLEKSTPGGKVNLTGKIDNYLGYNSISGPELAMKFYTQLTENKIDIEANEALGIVRVQKGFRVSTDGDTFCCRSLIVSSGCYEKRLEVENERKFLHRGVSYCAVCDGPLFRYKQVAIVGGGNSAFESALYLSSIAKKVYLVHRRQNFRAEQTLVNQVYQTENIEILAPYQVLSLSGDKVLNEMTLKNVLSQDIKKVPVSAIFPYVGNAANNNFLNTLNIEQKDGFIVVNANMESSIPGLFACGDIVDQNVRQIASAVGEGSIAAMNCIKYIKEK